MSFKRAVKILYGIDDVNAPINKKVCEDFLKGNTDKIDCELLTLSLNHSYKCDILTEYAYTKEGYISRHLNDDDHFYIQNLKRSFYDMLYDMDIEVNPFDGSLLETKDLLKRIPFKVTDKFIAEVNNHLLDLIEKEGWESIYSESI